MDILHVFTLFSYIHILSKKASFLIWYSSRCDPVHTDVYLIHVPLAYKEPYNAQNGLPHKSSMTIETARHLLSNFIQLRAGMAIHCSTPTHHIKVHSHTTHTQRNTHNATHTSRNTFLTTVLREAILLVPNQTHAFILLTMTNGLM